jgi:hypothetical protein
MGISWTISPSWPWITILLISASQVTRITGMSHQHPAKVEDFSKSKRN